MTVSEQELYGGSAKAVRCFVSKTFPRFFREEDIEDMTNEVALKAWKASDSYDPAKGAFYPWLWTIAKRVVLTHAEKLARERGRFTSLDDPEAAEASILDTYRGVEPPADSALLLEELQQTLLGKLPGERDQLILSWLVEGLEDGEIAERLGVSKQTVYMAVYHLRQRLRRAA